ncbi:hypothetical protein DPMN_083736 [Dreissena polymorpha]|uniref:Uncharacterized protein n=1 Tax=Dreissena polymorpha TaxID=45954 RepID=A0A9D3YBV1_DREPO|nr:hypothetical protein DPMN_083736 [Dreissena polymorpha]
MNPGDDVFDQAMLYGFERLKPKQQRKVNRDTVDSEERFMGPEDVVMMKSAPCLPRVFRLTY